jgi:hypothetical protein
MAASGKGSRRHRSSELPPPALIGRISLADAQLPDLPEPPPLPSVLDLPAKVRESRRYASARARAVADELEAEFARLKKAEDVRRRGAVFEKIVARLLHMNNFDVVPSARSAPGRQVDITATSPSMTLVVEAKWQRARIDINDVAGLADRLDRAAPGTIGLFISMSEYTDGARRRILDDKRTIARGRVMILLERGDVDDLLTGRVELRPLLSRRLESLRLHDRTREPVESTAGTRQPISLPGADARPAEPSRPPLASAAYDLVFVDASWYTRNTDTSYVLDLPLPERRGTLDDVRQVLELAHSSLVMSGGGGFTVTQIGPTPWTWHGSGVEPLLQCLGAQAERYRQAKITSPHHSEDFALVVPFEDGWLALSGHQSTQHSRHPSVRELHLELRLPYLPLDMDGIATLCRRLDMRGIGLTALNRPLVDRVRFRPPPVLKPRFYGTGTVLGETYITRSVVTNPWYGDSRAVLAADGAEYPWAGQLAQSSFIDASTGHALALTERVRRFSLAFVDAIQFSRVTAIHAQLHYETADLVPAGANRRAVKGHHGKSHP